LSFFVSGILLKKIFYTFLFLIFFILTSCKSTSVITQKNSSKNQTNSISLIFAGDIMAHTPNFSMKNYDKIWDNIKIDIQSATFSFANIEAPIDNSKVASTYPFFNMPRDYVEAAINAGFNVFSVANNHTNDQNLEGIKETKKSIEYFSNKYITQSPLYFSGLKNEDEKFNFTLIEKDGWKIIFLAITEILNQPTFKSHINYLTPNNTKRTEFIEFCKTIKRENPCDLFIVSIHANEEEYTREIKDSQKSFYYEMLNCGVDIVWSNHAHIIKDREIIRNTSGLNEKLIMYANGNTISGQRTNPSLLEKNPNFLRDNTGDGLLYKVTLSRENKESPIKIEKTENIFITTYKNTANEYIIKKMNTEFISYLDSVNRKDWTEYIKRRIKINNETTKETVIWQ
jgi:hypothetical protein